MKTRKTPILPKPLIENILSPQYLTYMQARMPESKTHTTYSNSPQKNPPVQGPSSNVDLLAGLDFAVNTPTLVPEAKPSPSKTADPAPSTVSQFSPARSSFRLFYMEFNCSGVCSASAAATCKTSGTKACSF
jgi:hypothetical protein